MDRGWSAQAWVLGVALVLSVTAAAGADSVRFVDDDAQPDGDGTSWATAYRFLQDALEVAADPVNGIADIRVAQGTYRPDRDMSSPGGTGQRTAAFGLIDGVSLMGGYAGIGAPDPDHRDIDLYETVLSGDLNGDDGPSFAGNDENSYHVVIAVGDETAVVDGFTISSGNANGGGGAGWGGGIYDFSSSSLISHCTFIGNSARSGGGMATQNSASTLTGCTFAGNTAARRGGGMFNQNNANPTLIGCTFADNSGDDGGGMFNTWGSSPMLTDCTFVGNTAVFRGGGMFNNADSNPTLTGCTFADNSTQIDTGGGMYNEQSCPVLNDCTFSGNASAYLGGGVYARQCTSLVLDRCTFAGNAANGLLTSGGGLYLRLSNATVTDCIFRGNTATGWGGGMQNFDSTATLTNCLFTGNSAAKHGGGMYNIINGIATLTNCTFSGNSAGQLGGGVYDWSSSPVLANCVLWSNTDSGGGGESAQIFNDEESTAVVNRSCIQGLTGDLGGVGNIGGDPLFVDADGPDNIAGTEDDNLRLSGGSPSIDAADNGAVPVGITTDLEGNPRFVDDLNTPDTGLGTPPIVDMGAYEFQASRLGDLDGDGVVNVLDLIILLLAFGDCPAPPEACPADLNGDGVVNVLDLIVLLTSFGSGAR